MSAICKKVTWQSREIISMPISYSWPLSHTPEIALWSSQLCPHQVLSCIKQAHTRIESILIVATHWKGESSSSRAYTVLLIHKVRWATLQLDAKTYWQHGDSVMEEISFVARLFQELFSHTHSQHAALFSRTLRQCSKGREALALWSVQTLDWGCKVLDVCTDGNYSKVWHRGSV